MLIFIFSCSSMKNFFFVNSMLTFMEMYYLILILLIGLVYYIVKNFNFFNFDLEENFIYDFLIFLIFFFMGMSFISESFFYFLFFYEISMFYIILMILNYSKGFDKIFSSIFMCMMNFLGSLSYILVLIMMIPSLGSLNLSFFQNFFFFFDNLYLFFLFPLLFFFKVPMFMMHVWLIKAHVSASGVYSIILASLMLKMGCMGLFKICMFYLNLFEMISMVLLNFTCLSFIYMSSSMMRSVDLKILIAGSSVVHMSYIPFLIFYFSNLSTISSYLMIISHGIISTVLFFIVTLIYEKLTNRSIFMMKGLVGLNFLFSILMILFICMNFGLPPFMSFVSEFLLGFVIFKNSLLILFTFMLMMIFCGFTFILLSTKFSMGKLNYKVLLDLNLNNIFLLLLNFFFIVYFFF